LIGVEPLSWALVRCRDSPTSDWIGKPGALLAQPHQHLSAAPSLWCMGSLVSRILIHTMEFHKLATPRGAWSRHCSLRHQPYPCPWQAPPVAAAMSGCGRPTAAPGFGLGGAADMTWVSGSPALSEDLHVAHYRKEAAATLPNSSTRASGELGGSVASEPTPFRRLRYARPCPTLGRG
jgi:hypothetical protein